MKPGFQEHLLKPIWYLQKMGYIDAVFSLGTDWFRFCCEWSFRKRKYALYANHWKTVRADSHRIGLLRPSARWLLLPQGLLDRLFPIALQLQHVWLWPRFLFARLFAFLCHSQLTLYISRFPSADLIAKTVRSPSFSLRWFQRKSNCAI